MYCFVVYLKSDVRCYDISDGTTRYDTRTEFFLGFSKTGARTTIDSMDLKIFFKNIQLLIVHKILFKCEI